MFQILLKTIMDMVPIFLTLTALYVFAEILYLVIHYREAQRFTPPQPRKRAMDIIRDTRFLSLD